MSSVFSTKVKALSFMAALMVVALHSYSHDVFALHSGTLWWVQEFLCQGICRVAVPFFFMIAGYFLFQNYPENWRDLPSWYGRKIVRRIRSLLVPYLIWLLIAYVFALCYSRVSSSHAAPEICGIGALLSYLGITGQPGSYYLWFIRSLMLVVLVSPVVGQVVRCRYVGPLSLAGLLAYNVFCSCEFSIGLFYMSIGAYLALRHPDALLWSNRACRYVLPLLWACLCLVRSILVWYGIGFGPVDIMIPINLIGVLALWMLGDRSHFLFRESTPAWVGASFYMYLAHPYVIFFWGIVVRNGMRVSPYSTWCYVLILLGGVPLVVLSWVLLRRYAPRLLCVLDGGRSQRETS